MGLLLLDKTRRTGSGSGIANAAEVKLIVGKQAEVTRLELFVVVDKFRSEVVEISSRESV
jgi:hypothetical protein